VKINIQVIVLEEIIIISNQKKKISEFGNGNGNGGRPLVATIWLPFWQAGKLASWQAGKLASWQVPNSLADPNTEW